MIKIQYIPNRFAEECHEYSTKTLNLPKAVEEFVVAYPHFAKPLGGKKVSLYINGVPLDRGIWATHICNNGDIVEITHTISDAFGFNLGWFTPSWALDMGLWLAGGWFLDLFEWDFATETAKDSLTYTWDGPNTSFMGDRPIALIYGEHLVGGQYINFNIWSDGADNWADFLISLGEGEIAGIVKEDQSGLISIPIHIHAKSAYSFVGGPVDSQSKPYIKLNTQFISEYIDCYWAGRTGINDQTAIGGFRNQKSSVNYSHKVAAAPNWTTPAHTTNTDIDRYTIEVTSPSLFAVFDSGNINPQSVKYKVRHRVDPAGDWVYTPNATYPHIDTESDYYSEEWYRIRGKTKTEKKAYHTITTASRDTYDIQVQRETPANTEISTKRTVENKLDITYITEIVDEELAFPNTALVAVRMKASDQISGSFPNVQTLVRGLEVRVPDLAGDGSAEFEDYYWDTGETFKLLANDSPLVWDTTSYVTQWTSNPAYIIRDLMLNNRYGFGEVVTSSDIDDDSINIAAKRCWRKVGSTHKNEIHIVIDTESDPPSLLSQLAQISRIFIFWTGGYVKFKYEEDENPVQLFTMGNIIKDSFKVDYADHTKTPNRVEVTFADKDDGWKKNTIEVVDETEWALGKAKRTKAISLIGVTDKAQALREAKLLLNKGRYSRKAVTFVTTIVACHSEPGDIIAFQHDVPQWGWGGRVISGDGINCVVDQEIPQNIIDDPTAYDIKIIHSDDTIETYDIASVSGKTVTIGGGDTFSPVPAEDESYILGKDGSTIAEYRIQNIKLTSDEEVQITAIEHNANIYSDTGLEISDDESTELPDPSAHAPQVTDLVLSVLYSKLGFSISYRQPENTLVWSRADIYLSTDGIQYTKIGEGYGDDYIEYTTDVSPGQKFWVRVYSINKIGIRNPSPVEDTIILKSMRPEGFSRPPSPTGLEIVNSGNWDYFIGRDCKFTWRLNAAYGGAGSLEPEAPAGQWPWNPAIIRDFKIEVWNRLATIKWREEYTTDNFYTYTYEKNAEDNDGVAQGDFHFRVYQRNWLNFLSRVPAGKAAINIPPSMSNITPVLTPSVHSINIDYSSYTATLTDLSHFVVYYGVATPLTASSSYVSQSTRNILQGGLNSNTEYYIQIEPYDVFSVGTKSIIASTTTTTVGPLDLSADSVAASHIQSAAVAESEIAAQAIVNAHMTASIITASLMNTAAILAAAIADAAINNSHISAAAITASVMAADSILASNIYANAVTAIKINTGAITAGKISAAAVEASHLKTGAITTRAIVASAITASLLEAGVIETAFLGANAVTANKMAVASLSAITAYMGTLTTGIMQSTDWGAADGVQIDLGNKWLKMGGSNVNATGDAAGVYIGYQA